MRLAGRGATGGASWQSGCRLRRAAWPMFGVSMSLLVGLMAARAAQGQYVDTAASCLLCHQTAIPQNDFCTVAAAAIWQTQDKHRHAFYLLHESRPDDPQHGAAKRALVRQILGFELREAFVDDRYTTLKTGGDESTRQKVATVKACLRCHATWPRSADTSYPDQPPVPLELGVSCQACHGPGERWDLPHRLPAWRLVTPAAKAELGFHDCRSLRGKTLLCASCHVGSVAEDRFVRHAWYAAGHPPLPSFHLARFVSQMPPHWRTLSEKGAFTFRDAVPPEAIPTLVPQREMLRRAGVPPESLRESYLAANGLTSPEAWSPQAEARDAAVLSAASVAEACVQLVADYAAAAAEQKLPWPELALYDCAACHHALTKEGRGRGLAPLRHPPGRPGPAVWPTALWPAVFASLSRHDPEHAARQQAALTQQWETLVQAMIAVPWGQPRAIAAAAQPLARQLGEWTQQVQPPPGEEAVARHMLLALTDPQAPPAYDYEMARQRAWAWIALVEHALPAERRERSASVLRDVETRLVLRLPAGHEEQVLKHLPQWLAAAAAYDPHWFRQQQAALREVFSPEGGDLQWGGLHEPPLRSRQRPPLDASGEQ